MSHLTLWLMIFGLFLVTGCVPQPPADSGPETIGTLRVDGANAFRNGARAADGVRIVDGDTVTTGPGTSVKLFLRRGGYVQLDENTDPEFRIFREGGCILVKILSGQMFVDAKRVCISDPNIEVALNSRVNLRVSGQQSTLTVIEGSVSMSRPLRKTLDSMHQYTVLRGMPVRIAELSPAEAQATADWAAAYFRSRPWPTPETSRPPAPPAWGWCCDDGRLASSTADHCRQSRGNFFTDERSARRYCAPPPPPPPLGWCCAGGKVAQLPADRCSAIRGQFFRDEATAQGACSPHQPFPGRMLQREMMRTPLPGWCCIGESLSPMPAERCAQSNGRFFQDERDARRACVIR